MQTNQTTTKSGNLKEGEKGGEFDQPEFLFLNLRSRKIFWVLVERGCSNSTYFGA